MRPQLTETSDAIVIRNEKIQARFTRNSAAGIAQHYLAADGSGNWVPIVEAFRNMPHLPHAAPLFQTEGTAGEYRILAHDALREMEAVAGADDEAVVRLTGASGGNRIVQTVVLAAGNDFFHIEIDGYLADRQTPKIEYLLSSFIFAAGRPDFVHAPCLKRAPDNVMADRVFHSPAAILQQAGVFAALAPDVDIINGHIVYAKDARPVDGERGFRIPVDPDRISLPAALDIDLHTGVTDLPVFSYGLIDSMVQQHVYWSHDHRNGAFVRELSNAHLRYGFDLFVNAEAPPCRGYQRISRYQWERYGVGYFRRPKPQVMPFGEYARICFPATFAYRGDAPQDTKRLANAESYDPHDSGPLETWLEFDLDGRQVGGIRTTPSQWYYDIQFMAWWNNVRDAVGLYWWGQRGDPEWSRKARLIVELALSAPLKEGIFPAIYRYNEQRWVRGYHKPLPPYDPETVPSFWDFASDYFQTASASKTAVHLLRYHRLCEQDPRIVPYVEQYGNFLLRHTDENGCVPAWFTDGLEPVAHLRFNAEGGVHIWFLAELYRATGRQAYIDAARRMAGFMIDEIVPGQRWADFETFYSCAKKAEATFDGISGQWPRCTLSMIWAIDGFACLYEMTGDRTYYDIGEAVADYAAFYQSVWQPHFIITAYAFGGYTSQNTDAEWLDMRQSQYGEALVHLARFGNRQDLMERGVAAVRAQLAVVNHPAIVANEVFAYPRYPYGVSSENIDHEGLPQIPLRTGFDWGEGGGLVGASGLMDQLGGAYIDLRRGISVGIDGVYIRSFRLENRNLHVDLANQLAELAYPYEGVHTLDLRIAGLAPGEYTVIVNSGARFAGVCESGTMDVAVTV